MIAQDRRPRFYEGQYLSAEDLAAIVEYFRANGSRHALGGHTWGIAMGLPLLERNAPGAAGRKEVVLQPGFAWDGFGRPLVVAQPTRLPESLFAGIPYSSAVDDPARPGGPVGRLIKVWINYKEYGAQPPAPGFETCAAVDASARVRETFDFVVGDVPPGPLQREHVTIGRATVDAADALRHSDPAAATLWDTSVPHQTFPGGPRPPRWLVPIGYVRWVSRDGDVGYFLERDKVAADKVGDLIRRFRRYVGTVTEYVEAAHDAIVLHRRGEDPRAPHRFARLMETQASADLLKDLVWVEGQLRIGGDAKLSAGRLHFRDADGLDQNTPLFLARQGDDPTPPGDGTRELRAVTGPVSQKNNRFAVGPEKAGAEPRGVEPNRVVVSGRVPPASGGAVGVNLANPSYAVHVK